MRVFLSHSSKDKAFVNNICDYISSDDIIIDEKSFIPGRLTTEEMDRNIAGCDIFVLFISSHSLENKNVNYEISQFKNVQFPGNKKFLPLIIESGIKYDDPRIPDWMREYNLRRVFRVKKAAACINEVIRLLTWQKYDYIRKKDSIFRGRNEYIEKFERRFNDRSLGKAVCYCVSGFETIGRTAFLSYCMKKVGKIRQEYSFPSFVLSSLESIEDFIFKLDELGVTTPVSVDYLSQKTLEEKIKIAVSQLNNFIENDEVVHIFDNGCIISQNGNMADWFKKVIREIDAINIGTKLAISAKYKCNELPSSAIWNISIPELSPSERQWLLESYLELLEIPLTDAEFNICMNWLQGYPQQVFYLAKSLSEMGFGAVRERSDEIVGFNMRKAEAVLSKYMNDDKKMSFIATIAKPEIIKVDDVIQAFGNKKYYKDLLTDLLLSSICVFIGVSNEYIRMNDTIRDFLDRKRFKINDDAFEKLKEKVKLDFENDEHGIPDSSDLYLYMNSAIQKDWKNKVNDRYVFPSHFSRCIKDIYNRRGDDNEVIKIADYLISKESYIDSNVIYSARYYLCLALARKKDSRVLQEARHLIDTHKHFVRGFYFRKTGHWLEAIDELKLSLQFGKNNNGAKRELVIAFLRLYEYEEAFNLAEEAHNNDPSNIYFAQAYFKCLLFRYLHNKDEGIEKKLHDLANINIYGDDEKENNMLGCMEAEYEYYINKSLEKSYLILDSYIKKYDKNIHALFTKFNLAERSDDIDMMNNVQSILKEIIVDLNQYEDVITRNDILIIAHKDGYDKANKEISKLSQTYSEAYKGKLQAEVDRISRHLGQHK